MTTANDEYRELPEHVRRIIERDGDIEFTPPSFERWLGRLQMLRTMSAMGAFMLVWLFAYEGGVSWEEATVRGIISAVVFYFFAWAAGLFIFGELYDGEIKSARTDLEQKGRERARRIEAYYRQQLSAQDAVGRDEESGSMDATHAMTPDPLATAIPGYVPSAITDHRLAA